MPTRYEEDFYLWSQEMAQALEERRFEDIDVEHLAEEIRDLGKSERRELANRLRVIMTHLLKLRFQPERRSGSWEATLTIQRKELQKLLRDMPSLRAVIAEEIADMYDLAVDYAAKETRIPRECFPRECPFTAADVMGGD
jgi:hypothetical protein